MHCPDVVPPQAAARKSATARGSDNQAFTAPERSTAYWRGTLGLLCLGLPLLLEPMDVTMSAPTESSFASRHARGQSHRSASLTHPGYGPTFREYHLAGRGISTLSFDFIWRLHTPPGPTRGRYSRYFCIRVWLPYQRPFPHASASPISSQSSMSFVEVTFIVRLHNAALYLGLTEDASASAGVLQISQAWPLAPAHSTHTPFIIADTKTDVASSM